MKRTWMVLLASLLVSSSILAAEPARQALADELVKAMDMDGQMQRTLEMMKKNMPGNMAQTQRAMGVTNEAAQKVASDAFEKSIEVIFSGPEWKETQAQISAIYADVFTEEELQGAIDFFKTPAGQAFVNKQAQVAERSMQLNQQFMMKVMPRLQAAMAELRAKHAPAPAPAAPPAE